MRDSGDSESKTGVDGLRVIDWGLDGVLPLGSTFTATATVRNTAESPVQQDVELWLGDPSGENVFLAAAVDIDAGAEKTVEFRIDIPPDFALPGLELYHGWKTGDDVVGTPATVEGPLHILTGVEMPDRVDANETVTPAVTVKNVGFEGSEPIDLVLDGERADSAEAAVGPGNQESIPFQFDASSYDTGRHRWRFETQWEGHESVGHAVTASDTVLVGDVEAPPPIAGDNPPLDLNGDGLYNDVTGDGEFDIFDVQALFDNLDTDAVQNNAEFFNFSGEDPTEVSVFDVQALFDKL